MKPTLVFICPVWSRELEELLLVTRESFSIKVLTQRQNLDFTDDYIEVLQCLESYSPLELGKLLPWLLQLPQPRFHLLLPVKANHRQLAGIGALLSMIKALPHVSVTHSPWPQGTWSFPIWLKAFQNLFDQEMSVIGRRTLSLPENNRAREALSSQMTSLQPYQRTWVFASSQYLEQEWQKILLPLLSRRENILELWNWEQLSIRRQNLLRQQFASHWEQFRTRPPRSLFEEWGDIQFLVLIGDTRLLFSETDLLDLAINHGVNIVMDTFHREKLGGPWKDGDTFWLWQTAQTENDERPWNNPYKLLPFSSKNRLEEYRDQLSNRILRSFIQLDFRRENY